MPATQSLNLCKILERDGGNLPLILIFDRWEWQYLNIAWVKLRMSGATQA